MTTVRVHINQAAIREFADSPPVHELLDRWGSEIAPDAQAAAPKRTGAGAASITHEVGSDDKGAYVRIGWTADRWYMIFAELGTSKETARPFLRPAALKHRTL